MRETCRNTVVETGRFRFIPACAGNIIHGMEGHSETPVHPRVCGKHLLCDFYMNTKDGSSPRVRETSPKSVQEAIKKRFIPACAGNIQPQPQKRLIYAVHPRVCGKHNGATFFTNLRNGSSPRVRETFHFSLTPIGNARFIPACAGNMIAIAHPANWLSVHPRVCGKHVKKELWTFLKDGSSPRVRETWDV